MAWNNSTCLVWVIYWNGLEFSLQHYSINQFVFYWHSNSMCIFLIVYVDDIVIIGSNSTLISWMHFINPNFKLNTKSKVFFWTKFENTRFKQGINLVLKESWNIHFKIKYQSFMSKLSTIYLRLLIGSYIFTFI